MGPLDLNRIGHSLSGLLDTDITTPASGNVLGYNGQKWVSSSGSSGSSDWGSLTNRPANLVTLGELGDSVGWLHNDGGGSLSYSTPPGTVSSGSLTETTSDVLTITGGDGAVIGSGTTIEVQKASVSVDGYLSSTDWNTFNSKQDALGFTAVPDTRNINTTAPLTGGGTLESDLTLSISSASVSDDGYLTSSDWSSFDDRLKRTTNITISKHYTGFPNRTDTTLSFDEGSRALVIAGTTWGVYIEGIEYSATGSLSTEITDTTGLYWAWITAPSGSLQLNSSNSHPGFDKCLVATVYWNTDINSGLLSEERHWMGRDRWMHEYLHETVGARYASGLTGTFTDSSLSITGGEFYDEDIEHTISEQTDCNVLYKNGSVDWQWSSGSSTVYIVDGAGKLRWNNGNLLASAGTGNYIAYWVYITNDTLHPVFSLIGERVDTTLANARANNSPSDLVFGTLPNAEIKLLYRVLYRQEASSVSYVEAADYRNVSSLPATSFIPTSHNVLSNLSPMNVTGHPVADSVTDGYITSVDWNTFNNKESAVATGSVAQYYRGDKTWQTLDKSAVGLSNVENTALSTWGGSTNITVLGTVASGSWESTPITDSYIASSSVWNAKQDAISSGSIVESVSDILTITGGSGSVIGSGVTIQVSQASSSSSGYLSSTDWDTFNNKVTFPGFGTDHVMAAYGDHLHTSIYEPASGNIQEHITTENALNGLVKVDGSGNYSAITDNSIEWDSAYDHSTQSTGSVHGLILDNVTQLGNSTTGSGSTIALSDSPTLVTPVLGDAQIDKITNLTDNGFVKTSDSDGSLSIDTNTYLTGNQEITLSGVIKGSGSTSIVTEADDGYYIPTTSDKSSWDSKEPALGNPDVDGYVLSSTTAGVRSWIAPASGSSGSGSVRVVSVTSSGSITPDIDTTDILKITALEEALTINNPTGSVADGYNFILSIRDNGVSRDIIWGDIYSTEDKVLPDKTKVGKTLTLGFIYNSSTSKWDLFESVSRVINTVYILSSGSITPDIDTTDIYEVSCLAEDITINAPTGSVDDGQELIFRILDDGDSRGITWDNIYRSQFGSLPSKTSVSKTIYCDFVYNYSETKWDLIREVSPSVVSSPGDDLTVSGNTIDLVAGVEFNFGDVGYIYSNGNVVFANSTSVATAPGVVMATENISSGSSGIYLLLGVARDDSWSWTCGGLIFLSASGSTGETLTQTAPTTTDSVTQILGLATHANRIIFNPQLVQVEHT